jgi:hypothetical protein
MKIERSKLSFENERCKQIFAVQIFKINYNAKNH